MYVVKHLSIRCNEARNFMLLIEAQGGSVQSAPDNI